MRTSYQRLRFSLISLVLLNISRLFAPAPYDWLQFNGDALHSGNNTQESILTVNNVGKLESLFIASLPAAADGAPVYLSAVNTTKGMRDLVFVLTRAGHIVALDAHSGEITWTQQNPAGDCKINNGSNTCYTTSSPVIDPNRQYVYSYGLDGYVHKYKVEDGTEIKTGGWPEQTTTKPFDEKGSSALSMATDKSGTTYLYMPNSGYPGDRGDYQGHLTTINLTDGSQHIFNTICSDKVDIRFVTKPGNPDCPSVQTALWTRAGVVYDAETSKLYTTTGNGDYDPGKHYWGDSVLALNINGTPQNGDPLDTYTPATFKDLQRYDTDLGSTTPAILPVPANSKIKHLAVQAGKDQLLRFLDLDNLNGHGKPGYTGGEIGETIRVPQGGGVLTTIAVWVNRADQSTWIFVTTGQGISGLQLLVGRDGIPALQEMWTNPQGGTSPIIAADILYYARGQEIEALDPLTGKQLWHDTHIGGIHWESPIVANGILYITDNDSKLHAYAVK